MRIDNSLGASSTSQARFPSLGNLLSKGKALTITAVALVALSMLPTTAEAATPVGAAVGAACYAGCVAGLAAATGGWGAFIGFTACKAACLTAVVAL
ncbi:MAG: hypothetical protein P0S96_02180 [Simkaniaceae bacterium]|nr:hypothetical protein [Candidatus Sacchlamyda saccharinae]